MCQNAKWAQARQDICYLFAKCQRGSVLHGPVFIITSSLTSVTAALEMLNRSNKWVVDCTMWIEKLTPMMLLNETCYCQLPIFYKHF